MAKYRRKKPVIVNAFQYKRDRYNVNAEYCIPSWAVKAHLEGVIYFEKYDGNPHELFVKTPDGARRVLVGDYIVLEETGEIHRCSSEIFNHMYEEVDNETD